MKRLPDPFPLRFKSPEDGHKFMRLIHERKPIPNGMAIRPWEPGYDDAVYELTYVQLEPGEKFGDTKNMVLH